MSSQKKKLVKEFAEQKFTIMQSRKQNAWAEQNKNIITEKKTRSKEKN